MATWDRHDATDEMLTDKEHEKKFGEGSVKKRGFGSMDPAKQREIASKGGRAAHAKGTAHEWNREEAKTAGRKGGQISRGGRGKLSTSDGAILKEFTDRIQDAKTSEE